MDWIVIDGVRPWDGRYEFDLAGSPPTSREWGWIKRLAGYLPLTLDEGFKGADPELFCVFAAIALRRAGKIEPGQVPDIYDRLIDAPFGATIRLEADTPDEEETEPEQDPTASSNGNGGSSGPGSPTSSETSEPQIPAPTGTQGWDSSVSIPVRWEN